MIKQLYNCTFKIRAWPYLSDSLGIQDCLLTFSLLILNQPPCLIDQVFALPQCSHLALSQAPPSNHFLALLEIKHTGLRPYFLPSITVPWAPVSEFPLENRQDHMLYTLVSVTASCGQQVFNLCALHTSKGISGFSEHKISRAELSPRGTQPF